MKICRSDRLFHYLLGSEENLPLIVERGILPLSAFPESEAWRRLEESLPGFYQAIYEAIGKPVLKRPYTNSGVFLTPIDFRLMPGSPLSRHTRITIPLEAVDPDYSTLTYVLNDERAVLPLSAENLEQAALLWPEQRVREWFGKNPNMIFFYVPQVAVYREGGISICPEWIEK